MEVSFIGAGEGIGDSWINVGVGIVDNWVTVGASVGDDKVKVGEGRAGIVVGGDDKLALCKRFFKVTI